MQNIMGKTAIITGASSGFGRASTYALAREGVNLVLTARSEDKLAAICAECEELGVRAVYVAGDCRDEQNADAVVFVCKQSHRTSRVMEMSLASMAGN